MLLRSLYTIAILSIFISCQEVKIVDGDAPAQIEEVISFAEGEHIKWQADYINDEIVITAYLAEGWMTYSQYNENFLGPLPSLITFEENENYSLIGKTSEENVKMKFDKESNDDLSYFETKAIFKQKVKINSGEKFAVKGNVNFMTCNANGCEPPVDFPFEIEINK
jgi:thiol:disulfide interchange protein DsbD